MGKAIDKFWLFGVPAGDDDKSIGELSRITPAEAAFMLDVPNMIMVNCDGKPVPFSKEAIQYCETFVPCKNVLWSASGSCGFRIGNEEAFICELAQKYDNITGAFLDDFFYMFKDMPDRDQRAIEMLKTIRTGLDRAHRKLDLYMVWYTYEFSNINRDLFKYVDGIVLWTWDSKELAQLKENYEKLEKLIPGKRKLLGIYLFDFYNKIPVSEEQMEHQCTLGLELMKQGRLDGLVFLGNSVMGVGFPSEKWLGAWIRQVKDIEVPD